MKKIIFTVVGVIALIAILAALFGWFGLDGIVGKNSVSCDGGPPLGVHPDGTEYFPPVDYRDGDSVCGNDGLWYYDPLGEGVEEVANDVVKTTCSANPASIQDLSGNSTSPCLPSETDVVDFGPEEAFPSKVYGPAIAELWNPNTGFCALVKINTGENLDWKHSGAWWQAGNQDLLKVRFPHHTAEYLAKPNSEGCNVYTSVSDMPLSP